GEAGASGTNAGKGGAAGSSSGRAGAGGTRMTGGEGGSDAPGSAGSAGEGGTGGSGKGGSGKGGESGAIEAGGAGEAGAGDGGAGKGGESGAADAGSGGEGGAADGSAIVVDAKRAVTLELDVAGGSIEATGGDGTVYRLALPAGALLGPVEITLTPVLDLTNRPLTGALHGGVLFEPDGLLLQKPGTLEIVPPSPLPSDAVVLAFDGEAAAYHAVPEEETSGSLRIMVTHFSGAGVASPNLGELVALFNEVTTGGQIRFEQESKRLADLVEDQAMTEETANGLRIAALDVWVDGNVTTLLNDARTDDELYELAVSNYLAARAWAEAIGATSSLETLADLAPLVETVHAYAWTRTLDRCVEGDSAMASRLQALSVQHQALGLTTTLDQTRVPRCLSFEVSGSIEVAPGIMGQTYSGSPVSCMLVVPPDVGRSRVQIEPTPLSTDVAGTDPIGGVMLDLSEQPWDVGSLCNFRDKSGKPDSSASHIECTGTATSTVKLGVQVNSFRNHQLRISGFAREGTPSGGLDCARCFPDPTFTCSPDTLWIRDARTVMAERVRGFQTTSGVARCDFTSRTGLHAVEEWWTVRTRLFVLHRPR
ncbi:MAG TPA: hypothetical protein VGK73_26100, partial [Polyangiaceae bacterium]